MSQNFESRTLFHRDNLLILRGMNSETIDLIATDPPFNKNKDFHATPDSLASGASFQDRWRWDDDVLPEWLDQLSDDSPDVLHVIEGSRKSYGDDMGAFLCFMGVRLLEMHRVLKETGSIYLHCDPTASHYLKELMDAIFGRKHFRNEIVWCYTGPGNARRWFPRKHDNILFFVKSDAAVFNREEVRIPYKTLNVQHADEQTGGGIGGRLTPGTVDAYRERGKVPEDYWLEDRDGMTPVGRRASERTGYPTQKPLALYERIIKASSSPGDWVLDPFCGCATTCVAAHNLGRRWVGIDLWDNARAVIEDRIRKETASRHAALGEQEQELTEVRYETEPPVRTDDGEEAAPFLRAKTSRPTEPWQRLSREDIASHLYDAQRGAEDHVVCGGCGRDLERPFMQLDHRQPRVDGGVNDITNRILLCQPCNGRKGAKLTLTGLVAENRKAGWMQDERAARHADHRARRRAEQVRLEEVPLRATT